MTPNRAVAAVLIGLALGACSYFERGPRVVSARRGKELRDGSGTNRPQNPSDVILLVEIAGLSEKEINAVPMEKIYVMAGEEKRGLSIRAVSYRKGGEVNRIKLGFAVPERASQMQLFIGDHPPKTVRASGKVQDELKTF